MHLCKLKDISEAVETGYFDVAARMLRNLIQEIEETNEKREWVGLEEPEIYTARPDLWKRDLAFAKAIEAKLKEKNNG